MIGPRFYFNNDIKVEYVKAAEKLPESERILYGPSGEYYSLSLKCFKYRSPSYVYELCPFKKSTQDDGINPTPTTLGKDGVLNFGGTPKVKFHSELGIYSPKNRQVDPCAWIPALK